MSDKRSMKGKSDKNSDVPLPIVKEGWVKKRSIVKKVMKMRYMMLAANSLILFDDEKKAQEFKNLILKSGSIKSALKFARGAIPLNFAKLAPKFKDRFNGEKAFGLIEGPRLYHFVCNSEAEAKSWLSTIEGETRTRANPKYTITREVQAHLHELVRVTKSERVRRATSAMQELNLEVEDMSEDKTLLHIRKHVREILRDKSKAKSSERSKALMNFVQHMADIINEESYTYLKRVPAVPRRMGDDPVPGFRMMIASLVWKNRQDIKKLEHIVDRFWTKICDILDEEAPDVGVPEENEKK